MINPKLPATVDLDSATGTSLTFPVGSTSPELSGTLRDADGKEINLAGVAAVRLLLTNDEGETHLDEKMRVTDANDGRVAYQWKPADVDTLGNYTGRINVQLADGRTLKLPSRYPLRISIVE